MESWPGLSGSPTPLGMTWNEQQQAYNFALFSAAAAGIRLLLFAADDLARPVYSRDLIHPQNKSGHVWHTQISKSEMRSAVYYGIQAAGPFDPGSGQRFDSQKLLLDPYARAVFFPSGFNRRAAATPGSNIGLAPLGGIAPEAASFDWEGDSPPRHTTDTVIYEAHVRGFTIDPSSQVAPERRGTFLGIIDKIPYLKDLGVTVVELMPVFQFDPQERNYWGYMPINFFSPHHLFAS